MIAEMLKSFLLIAGLAVSGLLLLAAASLPVPAPLGSDRMGVPNASPPEDQGLFFPMPSEIPPPKAAIRESEEIAVAMEELPESEASSKRALRPAVALTAAASSTVASSSVSMAEAALPPLPPLREDELFRAVVKIECPSEDQKGVYVGSGFVMPRGVVVTAAHLLTDMGGDTCKVIFPHNRGPAHYLFGTPEDREAIKKRHDGQGIDLAFLFLPALASYPEGKAVFPDGYPIVSYPVCARPNLIGDRLLHFGYPGNFHNNSYLARSEGEALAYGDITGVSSQLSEDQSSISQVPVLSYTTDQSALHPYLVSRAPSFYGDSGGLAFDATKQCILGVGHGGTMGGAAGENYSVLMMLGWEGVRDILP